MNRPDPVPADIAGPLDRAASRLGLFSGRLTWFEEIGSTNDALATIAGRPGGEGAVVAANAQTSGRGRLGRTWASPAGAGLYVSVLLRPDPALAPLVTLAAGVALADGIAASSGLAVSLKWPNDVVVGGRKLAGILAEGGAFVVLGFGINLRPAAYPPEISARATSLEGELGRAVDRGLVLTECLVALSSRYAELRAGNSAAVLQAWRARAAPLMGQAVTWEAEGRSHQGLAEDIAEDGALLVKTASGRERIISGEVRWANLAR